MDLVSLNNASLYYGEGPQAFHAVDRVDLSIKTGEFVAIVGPSGCGKSSLLKLISGLSRASSGEVVVSGSNVTGPLKIVGMAFQNATLLPWRTTLDNVMLPLEIVKGGSRSDRETNLARARELLQMVGLAGYEDKFPWELSGGMQQRVSLCRALVHKPSLLLLDEPFGALDAFTREELWGVLQDLWTEQKFTVFLVTHELREAVFLSDRVYVMSSRPGRIITHSAVELPRPRTLKDTFRGDFTAIVADLREHIFQAHGEKSTIDNAVSN